MVKVTEQYVIGDIGVSSRPPVTITYTVACEYDRRARPIAFPGLFPYPGFRGRPYLMAYQAPLFTQTLIAYEIIREGEGSIKNEVREILDTYNYTAITRRSAGNGLPPAFSFATDLPQSVNLIPIFGYGFQVGVGAGELYEIGYAVDFAAKPTFGALALKAVPPRIEAGSRVVLDASGSDPRAVKLTYSFDDGRLAITTQRRLVSRRYDVPGTYRVKLEGRTANNDPFAPVYTDLLVDPPVASDSTPPFVPAGALTASPGGDRLHFGPRDIR